jgi:Spx/MgsR family transcriptional regulator
MIDLTVYGIKTCSTVRKAIKELEAAGHDVNFRDVRGKTMGLSDWDYLEGKVGWDSLLNRKSQAWRNLEDADKADLNRDKAIELLVKKPNLMKRPLIDGGDDVTLGWTAETKSAYGL